MNQDHQQILLKTAAESIAAAVNHQPFAEPASDEAELNVQQGCFVTLKNHGRLRGCLGQFTSDKPLIELVAEMAQASATNDPRFRSNPITPNELNQLEVEISVLSPMKKTDDPLGLRLGIDGIYITNGKTSGCFLPQVATETGWTKEEFLAYCCSQKAFLHPDAWKDPDIDVYLFTADAFESAFTEICS